MAAKKKATTTTGPIEASLGFDSYRFGTETRTFESAPVARLEFRGALAAAKKRKKTVVDVTPTPDARWGALAEHADRMQLDWAGQDVRRAWMTAQETPKGTSAWELLELALANPMFAAIEELAIGLHRWNDSHRADYASVVDVLAARRPNVRALAFGDFVNESGHALRFERMDRIAELYPALERLRVSLARLPALGALALPKAKSIWARGIWRDAVAHATFERAWPELEKLGIGWTRSGGSEPAETVRSWEWLLAGEKTPRLRDLTIGGSTIWPELLAELVRSPLLPRLRRLDLRSNAEPERDIGTALRPHARALVHLEELVVPRAANMGTLADEGVKVREVLDRSEPHHRD